MFKNNTQQSKLFNSNLPWFSLLCFIGTIYLGAIVSPWYFLFLLLVVLISLNIKINKWQLLFCIGIICIFLILLYFVPSFSLFQKISNWTKSDFVRNKIFDYLDSIYSKEISSFIKLVLFSVKSNETYVFYKQTVDLGIVWLICVGGFHISFLSRLIHKIFNKVWKIGKWIDVLIIFTYSYLLRFSYSSLRVLFMLLCQPFFNKFHIKSYNKLGLIGLLFCLINPSCFTSYSFMLSFVGVTSAYYVQSLKISNKLINKLMISSFGFISTIPFVINLNHKISLFTFVNSFIFTYLFVFIFLYFLLFSWIPFMAIIHQGIIVACYAIIGNISYLNIYITCSSWEPYFVFAFYSGYYAINKLLYLIVYYNKI